MYNIHPIFVHFPIALLLIYSIIKILPFEKWFPTVAWRDIERLLLLLGVLGAFVSSATGELAEELSRPNHKIVEVHAFFAVLSTWLYGALLAGEVLAILNPKLLASNILVPLVQKISVSLEKLLCNGVLSKVVAFLALIAITVTGLLGGVMVYGTSADPLAGLVLNILGLTI